MTLDQLNKIVDGATEGPWIAINESCIAMEIDGGMYTRFVYLEDSTYGTTQHIATFNPQRVKAMLAVIDAAKHLKSAYILAVRTGTIKPNRYMPAPLKIIKDSFKALEAIK